MKSSLSLWRGLGFQNQFFAPFSGKSKVLVLGVGVAVHFIFMAWSFSFRCFSTNQTSDVVLKTKETSAAKGGNKKEKKSDRKRKLSTESAILELSGCRRGIEGSRNSCYLDAFLFSLFYATNAFDEILEYSKEDVDIARNTKHVLKNTIVSLLRENLFCPASKTMQLRTLLKEHNPKIMGSFQAIEDVVYLLFENVLNLPKFIQYEDDASGYMHVMLADEGTPRNSVVKIQECFEYSMMMYGGLKFNSVPSPAFILSLPWHKNRLHHHKAIIPSLVLKINGNISDHKCDICSTIAVWESHGEESEDEDKFLCDDCIDQNGIGRKFVKRTEMMLTSVMCFRGAHFTAIVQNRNPKFQIGRWYYFDSMSGGSSEVTDITDPLLEANNQWEDAASINGNLQWNVKAFFTDAHTCIYEPIFYSRNQVAVVEQDVNKYKRFKFLNSFTKCFH